LQQRGEVAATGRNCEVAEKVAAARSTEEPEDDGEELI